MPQILENDSAHSPINFKLTDALSTSAVGSSSSDEITRDDDQASAASDSTVEVDRLLGAFSISAKGLRPCLGYLISQVSLERDGIFRIIEVPCGCWECKKCGPKLKVRWYERLKGAVLNAPYLEALTIDRSTWKAYRVALRRGGTLEYIKLTQADDKFLVLAPGEIGGKVVPMGRRKSFLINALEAVPFTMQPISTSRGGWVRSSHRKKGDESWKTMDTVRPEELEECEEKLEKFYDRGVTTVYNSTESCMGSVRALEFFIPVELMKDGTWCKVLWALGIHVRMKGESRWARRQERIEEMIAAGG